jgi:hypothetical protein
MSIAAASLKHITAMSFEFAPLSASQASRSMRLLLARLPTKPPMPGMDLPDISTKTVPTDALQRVEITYKNKQKLVLDHQAAEARLTDLVKKVRLATAHRPLLRQLTEPLTYLPFAFLILRLRSQHEPCVSRRRVSDRALLQPRPSPQMRISCTCIRPRKT